MLEEGPGPARRVGEQDLRGVRAVRLQGAVPGRQVHRQRRRRHRRPQAAAGVLRDPHQAGAAPDPPRAADRRARRWAGCGLEQHAEEADHLLREHDLRRPPPDRRDRHAGRRRRLVAGGRPGLRLRRLPGLDLHRQQRERRVRRQARQRERGVPGPRLLPQRAAGRAQRADRRLLVPARPQPASCRSSASSATSSATPWAGGTSTRVRTRAPASRTTTGARSPRTTASRSCTIRSAMAAATGRSR